MFTGIDIGGTNTDIAVIDDGISTVKISNEKGIIPALRMVKSGSRLSVSTSQALNEIMVNPSMRIRTITIPGPGLIYGGTVRGAVSHRGEIVEPIDPDEIHALLKNCHADGIAIAGKFSVRNPALEEQVYEIVSGYFPADRIATSAVLGCLHYPARIETTRINARIMKPVVHLTRQILSGFSGFFYVTSRGGLVSPDRAMNNPSLLYHSSPATVAHGAYYLSGERDCLVVDIGGTTTDLIPLRDGAPELFQVLVNGRRTLIESVYVRSLPLGGDSCIRENLCRFRAGNARAFGGGEPTLTDALNVLGARIGDHDRSSSGLSREDAKTALETYYEQVAAMIRDLNPARIIGTGFLSHYLIPELAERVHIPCIIPEHADCANAVGAAVSRISIEAVIHADTARKKLLVNGKEYPVTSSASETEILDQSKVILREIARNEGAPVEDIADIRVSQVTSYPVIRNGLREGVILDAVIGIRPGITTEAP